MHWNNQGYSSIMVVHQWERRIQRQGRKLVWEWYVFPNGINLLWCKIKIFVDINYLNSSGKSHQSKLSDSVLVMKDSTEDSSFRKNNKFTCVLVISFNCQNHKHFTFLGFFFHHRFCLTRAQKVGGSGRQIQPVTFLG